MIIRLAGALGVAVLALSFSLGNSSACPKATETPAAASESVTGDAVADAGVPASDISERKIDEIAPSTAAEGPAATASAVAAPPVEMPETATIVAPVQRPDDSENLAITASIAAIVSKIEPSSDVNEPSAPELPATAGALTESDVAEWNLIFDAASAPAAAVIEGSPATIGAVETIPAEPVEAISPASDGAPASPEIEITGAVPQHTAATEDPE